MVALWLPNHIPHRTVVIDGITKNGHKSRGTCNDNYPWLLLARRDQHPIEAEVISMRWASAKS